jgi:hypothetical protein
MEINKIEESRKKWQWIELALVATRAGICIVI